MLVEWSGWEVTFFLSPPVLPQYLAAWIRSGGRSGAPPFLFVPIHVLMVFY